MHVVFAFGEGGKERVEGIAAHDESVAEWVSSGTGGAKEGLGFRVASKYVGMCGL